MMMDIEQARHAHERGDILRTLKEDYGREMTTVRALRAALDLQQVSLSVEDLSFHLRYLSDAGYLRIICARDLPGYRRDRATKIAPDTIIAAKLLPRGLQLLDGLIAEDVSVKF